MVWPRYSKNYVTMISYTWEWVNNLASLLESCYVFSGKFILEQRIIGGNSSIGNFIPFFPYFCFYFFCFYFYFILFYCAFTFAWAFGLETTCSQENSRVKINWSMVFEAFGKSKMCENKNKKQKKERKKFVQSKIEKISIWKRPLLSDCFCQNFFAKMYQYTWLLWSHKEDSKIYVVHHKFRKNRFEGQTWIGSWQQTKSSEFSSWMIWHMSLRNFFFFFLRN